MRVRRIVALAAMLALACALPVWPVEAADPIRVVPGGPPRDRCDIRQCPDPVPKGPSFCLGGMTVDFAVCAHYSGEPCAWTYTCRDQRCIAAPGSPCGLAGPGCECDTGFTSEPGRSWSVAWRLLAQ